MFTFNFNTPKSSRHLFDKRKPEMNNVETHILLDQSQSLIPSPDLAPSTFRERIHLDILLGLGLISSRLIR